MPNLEESVSALVLLFTNTSVPLCPSMSSLIRCIRATVDGETNMSFERVLSSDEGSGNSTLYSGLFVDNGALALTILHLRRVPQRNLATSSGFPTVADRPILCIGPLTRSETLSRARESCAPRRSETSSWTSSTIIQRRGYKFERSLRPIRIA